MMKHIAFYIAIIIIIKLELQTALPEDTLV